jgi:tRNA(fMet)-specific endonuclease VapC
MSFLLDRDTCEHWIRGAQRVANAAVQHQGRLHISAATVMALELWLLHARTPSRHLQGYGAILQQDSVVIIDEDVAHRAASVGARLTGQRPRLTPIDLLVAATALVHGLTLVTHDLQHYARVPGLTIVDWLMP